ncbi:MAG: hypothetical protein K2X39_06985, partial [Silvanigrellaceae bacterium]|nr:hypothetical protein [Silvanigrellaceae bacterium]
LCYSGQNHPVDKIHRHQNQQMKRTDVIQYAHRVKEIAYEMKSALLRAEFVKFGALLHESWHLKKLFSNDISNSYFDSIYDFALENGAVGGKLIGAGGGGFFLFQSEFNKKKNLVNALKEKKLVSRDFIFDDKGANAWII